MRRGIFAAVILISAGTCLGQTQRFSSHGPRANEQVSLEIVNRLNVVLTVTRPDYHIRPTEIRLHEPLTMDGRGRYRFAGETPYLDGTLRVRGYWMTHGTPDPSDDQCVAAWIYYPGPGRTGGNEGNDDLEMMEADQR
ncbi:MAG: hypothetical protein AAGF97_02885 [Planctomycetota bacterium]